MSNKIPLNYINYISEVLKSFQENQLNPDGIRHIFTIAENSNKIKSIRYEVIGKTSFPNSNNKYDVRELFLPMNIFWHRLNSELRKLFLDFLSKSNIAELHDFPLGHPTESQIYKASWNQMKKDIKKANENFSKELGDNFHEDEF